MFNNNKKIDRLKRKWLRPVHIIVLGVFGVIMVGSLLLWLPISHKDGLSYVDALFTAASATCLTGLGVVNLSTSFTLFGQIVVLAIIQISGLGLMTLATVIMMILRKRFTLKDRMLMQEALGHDSNQGVVRLTKNVAIFVFSSELIGALILMPFFVSAEGARGIYTAIFTSISAFCNAGLDIFEPSGGLSLYAGSPVVCLTVALLIILGGIGFTAVIDVAKYRLKLRRYHLHTKVALTASAVLLLIGTAAVLVSEWNNAGTIGGMSFFNKLVNAFFQSATCRTAGFSTFDQSALSASGRLASGALMFIGGSPASAAGGVKTTTVAVVLIMLVAGLRRKDEIVIFGRTVNTKTCVRAAAAMVFGLVFVFGLAFCLMLSEQSLISDGMFDSGDLMFEAVSAFATVGLSSGLTPHLSGIGKLLIILGMIMGKIGAISLGAMFFTEPQGGKGMRYPEGSIHIG